MFEQAVSTSEALREAAGQGRRPLIPALSGCPDCGRARLIAAPVLGVCEGCGAELQVLGRTPTADAEP